MKIYTKTGDQGETQVYASEVLRKRKDDTLLQCYGTLDELNSHIGLLIAQLSDSDIPLQQLNGDTIHHVLLQIQKDIFNVGFALSNSSQLREHSVQWLEDLIDVMTNVLPVQTRFILPGGSLIAAQSHVCRTVARRAERELVALSGQHECDPVALQYINRLSDTLFVFARWANHHSGIDDTEI